MSEEKTQDMPDWRSFEERVFARFDAMDKRFDMMDKRFDGVDQRLDGLGARVQKLEAESERRAVETKPIWERALAEILKIQQELSEVKVVLKDLSKKIDVLSVDNVQMRATMRDHELRLDKLEA
jgi:hypothetical protein